MAKAAWLDIPGGLRRLFAGCRTRGSAFSTRCLPLVAAAALAAFVLVVTVATAGLAMLMDVLVVVAVAAARGLAVLYKRAGDERLDARIAAALAPP